MHYEPAKFRKFWHNLVLSVGIALTSADLQAAVISPVGLAPGSQYQLMFVTTGTINALSSNIEDYNAFAVAEAALNPLLPATTWRAVVSTIVRNPDGSFIYTPASANAPLLNLPIYNTQGELVASAGTNIYGLLLPGPIQSPPRFSQFGLPVPNTPNSSPHNLPDYSDLTVVWTGGQTSGDAPLGGSALTFGYGVPEASVIAPLALLGGSFWPIAVVPQIAPARNPSDLYPIYALSGTITVPVPEPNTLVLLGLAIIALVSLVLFRRWVPTAVSTGH